MNGYQSHLLTPSIGVELSPQKQQAIETQKARLDRTYTGGGGQSAAAGVPSFASLLNETTAFYQPEIIEYHPLSEQTISDRIAAWLRPTYDRAIENRRERTQQYNANLDADAWARGMGASSYVSDVKSRNYGDESRDVGSIEAAYGATLAEHLFDALKTQAQKRLEVDQFNAEQINTARARAYDAATALYHSYLNAASKGGSGGSKKSASGAVASYGPQTAAAMRRTLQHELKSSPMYDRIEAPSAKAVEDTLSRMSQSERNRLYAANTRRDAKTLAQMQKSVGRQAMADYQRRYSLAK